jgi:inorganic pyrophosphatase
MRFSRVTLGDRAPALVTVVVEIPRGSTNKYEYDETSGEIGLDRVLHAPMFYPTEYGFLPQTRAADGDHLDVMVLISQPTFPGCVLRARPIGLLDMEDDAGQDWKVIAVAENDPMYRDVHTLDDLPQHFKREVKQFFESYKVLEEKWTAVRGWRGAEDAHRTIMDAHRRYRAESPAGR